VVSIEHQAPISEEAQNGKINFHPLKEMAHPASMSFLDLNARRTPSHSHLSQLAQAHVPPAPIHNHFLALQNQISPLEAKIVLAKFKIAVHKHQHPAPTPAQKQRLEALKERLHHFQHDLDQIRTNLDFSLQAGQGRRKQTGRGLLGTLGTGIPPFRTLPVDKTQKGWGKKAGKCGAKTKSGTKCKNGTNCHLHS
jgi:hypothetical protein